MMILLTHTPISNRDTHMPIPPHHTLIHLTQSIQRYNHGPTQSYTHTLTHAYTHTSMYAFIRPYTHTPDPYTPIHRCTDTPIHAYPRIHTSVPRTSRRPYTHAHTPHTLAPTNTPPHIHALSLPLPNPSKNADVTSDSPFASILTCHDPISYPTNHAVHPNIQPS